MGNQRRKREREHSDSGFKISELLTQLAVRRTTPPNGPLPHNVSLLPTVQGTNATTRSKAQLPECITRLSDTQCRKWYHQRQATPFSGSTPTPALNPTLAGHTPAPASANSSQPGGERSSLVSPDSFFLPYLAARETVKRCDSLVCPDILGVKEWSKQRPAAWTKATTAPQRMSIEPGVTSVHYFEDLRDLQRKLFKGIL
ncbi:hypothetical protein J4Q44_G00228260 [Coregonus suidteri]|uniref:Uncharacterized protein n=1 Tax=Coregonus suidteri TaxID=861788 RepID=A0AAN8QND1_9TELE